MMRCNTERDAYLAKVKTDHMMDAIASLEAMKKNGRYWDFILIFSYFSMVAIILAYMVIAYLFNLEPFIHYEL